MIEELIRILEEEYGKKGWVYPDPETFAYFRSLGKPVAAPPPKRIPPPPK
jgi:hypothetical protein